MKQEIRFRRADSTGNKGGSFALRKDLVQLREDIADALVEVEEAVNQIQQHLNHLHDLHISLSDGHQKQFLHFHLLLDYLKLPWYKRLFQDPYTFIYKQQKQG